MSRPVKILFRVLLAFAALIVVATIALVFIVRSQWFQNYARQKVISTIEQSTGGRVDLNSFHFNLQDLTATAHNFVLHGTEPAGSPPLLEIPQITVRLRLLVSPRHWVDIEYLGVDQPKVNVLVSKNGQTNIPTPPAPSNKPVLNTIVDLAIGKVDINRGRIHFFDKEVPLDIHARNVNVDLAYNSSQSQYQGQASLALTAEDRAPLNAQIKIPVILQKNAIIVSNATVNTPASSVVANAAVRNLASPEVVLQADAHIAVAELAAFSGLPIRLSPQTPQTLDTQVALSYQHNGIALHNFAIAFGETHLEAAGAGSDLATFRGVISVTQLARIFEKPSWPSGSIQVTGTADLKLPSYSIAGLLTAPDLAFHDLPQEKLRVASSFQIAPNRISIPHLAVSAFGGDIVGNGTLVDLKTLSLSAEARNFHLQTIERTLFSVSAGYSGSLSGRITATGNLQSPDIAGDLVISPGSRGIPVSGNISAKYSGADSVISISSAVIQLPHSDLTVRGEPGREAELRLTSHNLRDLSPALALVSRSPQLPLQLDGGSATIAVTERGPLNSPELSGDLQLTHFAVQGRHFDQLSAAFGASASDISLRDGILIHGASQARFTVSAGLVHWKPEPDRPLNADVTIHDGALADFTTLAGKGSYPASGSVNAAIQIAGTIANPRGTVNVDLVNGRIDSDSFDRARLIASLSDRHVELQTLEVTGPAGHIQAKGSFTHSSDDFETGSIRGDLVTGHLDLAQLNSIQTRWPGLSGSVDANVKLAGSLEQKHFELSSVNGDVKTTDIRDNRQNYGTLTATAHTNGSAVEIALHSSFAGSSIEARGGVRLAKDYPVDADISIDGLSLERAAAAFPAEAIPATGLLNATAHLAGTIDNPAVGLKLRLVKGEIDKQPIGDLQLAADYTSDLISITSLRLASPAGVVQLSGSYSHPAAGYQTGHVDLHLGIPSLTIQDINYLHTQQPALSGSLQVTGDISGELSRNHGKEQFFPSRFNATGGLRNLAHNGNSLGELSFAGTTKGADLSLTIQSTLAQSSLQATGTFQLTDNYPANVSVRLTNLTYSGIRELIGGPSQQGLEASLNASATFRGPLLDPEAATGELTVSDFNLSADKTSLISSSQPLSLRLAHQTLYIDNARLTGPSTDIAVSGSVGLTSTRQIDLAIKGNSDIGAAKKFYPGAVASGIVDLTSTVRGTITQPLLSGRVQIKDGSLHLTSWPNGIYHANGVILLSGTGGTIQSFSAESGGGKVTLAGFFGFNGAALAYDLHAAARQVRTRYSGASLTTSATLTLSGSSRRGILDGTVTISRIGYGQQSDIGSILSAATSPPSPPSASSGFLSTVGLNVHIQTSSGVQFQTTLAQELSATADLTMSGTLQNPGMLGRINVTAGTLIFFANKYTVNRGSISFYDATTIQPVLDVDLKTTVQGVDVDLTVAGPIDNLKLTYVSDPPLRFEDIIALLAAGKTPPDPTIAVNQPAAPDQSAMQMGESAIVGAAIANPISSRLQRVFGLTQLTISPTFVSGTALPQARVTVQQQISNAVTFTYSQDLSQTNAELVRIEWALTSRFSAVATRDENGIFGIDFFYKKQFH